MRHVSYARMWWVGLVVMVGLVVAQAQTRRAPLTSNEQKLDALQTAADGSALPRYQDNGDGTITDKATGLTWMKADSGKGMDWPTALEYAEDLKLAGHADWRLPNAKELQSIID